MSPPPARQARPAAGLVALTGALALVGPDGNARVQAPKAEPQKGERKSEPPRPRFARIRVGANWKCWAA